MTGPNRHYIWQMLQRGFLDGSREPKQPWVYKKNALPKQVSIKKYGSAEDFYSDEADLSLTNFERSAANVIQHARQAPDGAEIDPEKFSQILTSFEMRSRFIRDELSIEVERSIKELSDIYINPKTRGEVMANSIKRNLALKNMLKQAITLGRTEVVISDDLLLLSIEKSLTNELESDPLAAREFATSLVLSLKESARQGQSNAIRNGFRDIERAKLHQNKTYISLISSQGLILPDTYIAHVGKKGIYPVASKEMISDEVIIPIAADRFIYGFSKFKIKRSGAEINAILASCSFESFLANTDIPVYKKLISKIGNSARLMTHRERSDLLSQEALLRLVNQEGYPYTSV